MDSMRMLGVPGCAVVASVAVPGKKNPHSLLKKVVGAFS